MPRKPKFKAGVKKVSSNDFMYFSPTVEIDMDLCVHCGKYPGRCRLVPVIKERLQKDAGTKALIYECLGFEQK